MDQDNQSNQTPDAKSTPDIKPCCKYHNANCLDHAEVCCEECPLYNGTGQAPTDPHSDWKTCPTCQGSGREGITTKHDVNELDIDLVDCSTCHGLGKVASEPEENNPDANVPLEAESNITGPPVTDEPYYGYKDIEELSWKGPQPPTEAVTTDCPRCGGTGENPEDSVFGYPGEPCYYCLGTGNRPDMSGVQPSAVTADGLTTILENLAIGWDSTKTDVAEARINVEAYYNAKFERALEHNEVRDAQAADGYEDGYDHGWDDAVKNTTTRWYSDRQKGETDNG